MSSPNPSASGVREEQRRMFARIADLEEETSRLKRAAGFEGDAVGRAPQLTSFAGGVIHDFATLLTCILAEADLALATMTQETAERERIERIRNLAVRAGSMAHELMDFPDRKNPEKEPVDMSRLTAETLQLLASSIPAGAVVEAKLPEGLPAVNGNFTQLQRVTMNLIANAAEALGGTGGAISVRVSEAPAGPGAEHSIRLEVADTGCGMTEDAKERIFDPRYTTKARGRGLGLASAWEIVHAHGGTIQVTSAPGQGARFEVLLPAATMAASTPEHPAADDAPQPAAPPATVLFIEDDELLRHVVARLFREKGFGVLAAADGKSALDLFRSRHKDVDAVFLDATLPEMSGGEVLEQLRKIQPGVKVILTTAHSEEAALAALGDQRPWRFIRKPYRLLELIDLIQDAGVSSGTGGAHA